MKQVLRLKAGQTLAMTPALQQAIRMLQLSSLDLRQEIHEAIESNVMLEFEEPGGDVTPDSDPASADADTAADAPAEDSGSESADDTPVDIEWDEQYETGVGRSAQDEQELYDRRQAGLTGGTSLADHLLWQAELAPLDDRQVQIAAHFVDAVNDEGYLEDWEGLCERLTESLSAHPDELASVLRIVQAFDPPGVAARNLAECMRLQLEQLEPQTPGRAEALRAVPEHLGLLARHDDAGLQAALDLDAEALSQCLALIHSLQPHPGRPFQSHESAYVAPDVFVAKRHGRWRVSLNPDIAPRVRLNAQYVSLVKRADQTPDQQTLKQHLQEARYFLGALESRNDTLLRVAQCIVEEQRAFLDYGDEAMRPLVLRDIADRLGIHESTVSRATANKYMLTPRGLFELKHFFSSHVQTVQGGTASATAIQAMIKRLVSQEPAHRPLSDSVLAKLLLKDGVRVARRTVAKYRESLGIPPSHERKAVA